MLTLPNLAYLDAFVTIVETGSFRKAATHLHKAQSALSYMMSQLEKDTGLILFEPTAYRATLTKKGETYFPKAKQLLRQADHLSSFGQSLKDTAVLSFSLSVSSLFPLDKLVAPLKDLQHDNPNTTFTLQIETLTGLDRLINKDVDFAIVETLPNHPDITVREWERVCMPLVCANSHPLASVSKQKPKDELFDFPQIIVKSSGTKPTDDRGIIKGAKRWIVSDMSHKKQLLLHGFGWGRMPKHMIEHELEVGLLKPITHPSYPEVSVVLYLAYRKGSSASKISKILNNAV